MTLYNNLAYHNGYGLSRGPNYGVGFAIYNTTSDITYEARRVLKNNISFGNEKGNIWVHTDVKTYTHDHNTWDLTVTVNVADFMSLDTLQLWLPRKADGSLPDITFGKLTSTSNLRDKGVDVGLPFEGSAPDLGYYEYVAPIIPTDPIIIITTVISVGTTQATCGGNVTDDGGSTIYARGVCWGLTANPSLINSHTTDGTGTGAYNSYLSGLTPNTTYHVRAYAINTDNIGYGEDLTFTTTSGTGLNGDIVFDPVTGKKIYVNVGGVNKTVIK
jgi:hypothetical protein